ncbi:MAG: hypothetical protein ACP5IC_00985, partial [Minisyncoccia bacterium]
VSLSHSGSLVQSSTTVPVAIYDSTNPSLILATTTLASTTAQLTITNGWTVPQGTTRTLVVKINGTPANLVSVTSGTGSYQILLQGVTWNDGVVDVSSLSPNISLPISGQSINGLSN